MLFAGVYLSCLLDIRTKNSYPSGTTPTNVCANCGCPICQLCASDVDMDANINNRGHLGKTLFTELFNSKGCYCSAFCHELIIACMLYKHLHLHGPHDAESTNIYYTGVESNNTLQARLNSVGTQNAPKQPSKIVITLKSQHDAAVLKAQQNTAAIHVISNACKFITAHVPNM